MDRITYLLNCAARFGSSREDGRSFTLGAIGVRSDGAIVQSRNSSVLSPMPEAHAEFRLCKKLDSGAVVFVARTLKDGTWGLARPCPSCLRMLKTRNVKKVYYTIGPGEYGIIDVKSVELPTHNIGKRLPYLSLGRWNGGTKAYGG